MRLKGFIFDMDGTLGDTFPVIFLAFRAAFLKVTNCVYSDIEITKFFGPSETGAFKKFDPEHWQTCLDTYLTEYEKVHGEKGRLYPGIETTLNLLKQKGIKTAIVTGKCPESLAISLRYFGIEDRFEWIETGSEEGPNKPEGILKIISKWGYSPNEIAYIGDTAYDISASRTAGVLPLSAAWSNLTDTPNIQKEKPFKIFYQVKDLNEWINELESIL